MDNHAIVSFMIQSSDLANCFQYTISLIAKEENPRLRDFGILRLQSPLLFASGPGSEVQRPLAVVVVGGLFTATS